MKVKRTFSVKWRMVGLMLLCWFLPFLLVVGVSGYYMFGSYVDTILAKETEQLAFTSRISGERLDYAVDISKKASYDGAVNEAFRFFGKGEMDAGTLMRRANYYLYKTYSHEDAVKGVIFWAYKDPMNIKANTYNESAGGTYRNIQEYWEKDHRDIKELAKSLDTSIGFWSVDGRLYIIRNMLDNEYNKIGVLVMLVNQGYCFENLTDPALEKDVTVKINDCTVTLQGKELTKEKIVGDKRLKQTGYSMTRKALDMYSVINGNTYNLTTFVRYYDVDAFTPFYGYRVLLLGMLALLLPFLLLTLRMFGRYVTKPIESLMKGAVEIEKGNLGYRMEEETESEEFKYLTDSFNEMSEQLKYQFDHIYEEEIALRDAKIMALQSHINPHFMNNTLEIINWEARMAGNAKVSEMIEALSTLMDATIDRKKRPEVLLSEEMIYVNAYLRILKERLGKRLTVHNELPEEIMGYEVPRLILQPIIENAVEHGAVRRGRGTVTLKGHREGRLLYLEIYNDGTMSEEEAQKVKRLLAPDYDTSKEASGSLGIANVNQRLRILYGAPCGLTIEKAGEGQVVARLTILVDKEKEESKKIQEITE